MVGLSEGGLWPFGFELELQTVNEKIDKKNRNVIMTFFMLPPVKENIAKSAALKNHQLYQSLIPLHHLIRIWQ